jgi:hypothetical protein
MNYKNKCQLKSEQTPKSIAQKRLSLYSPCRSFLPLGLVSAFREVSVDPSGNWSIEKCESRLAEREPTGIREARNSLGNGNADI